MNGNVNRSDKRTAAIALFVVGGFTAFCSPATAALLGDYAIFAGHQVTFTSSMNVFNAPLGLVGSNGDISFPAGATVRMTNVNAGGSMLGNPSFLNAQNNLVFDGSVQFAGQSQVGGNVDAGGTATLGATAGKVTATGDVTINGSSTVGGNVASNGSVLLNPFATAGSNVSANQNLTLGNSAKIVGNATYGNQLSIGPFATIGGTQTNGLTLVNPVHFSPIPIAADLFSAGGPDISSSSTTVIAPGHYGNLSINGGTIKLSPGQYFFNSVLASSSFMSLDLDLSQPGNIEIFVSGNYDIPLQVVKVNGVDATSVDPQLGRRVFLESLGNIHIGWDNLGTMFAPNGDISLDSLTNVWGQAIAGHDAIFGGGDHLDYVPSNHLAVPEPATIVMSAAAGVLLAMSSALRRRRRAA